MCLNFPKSNHGKKNCKPKLKEDYIYICLCFQYSKIPKDLKTLTVTLYLL